MDNERCVSELLNGPFQRLHLVFHTAYLCECCCQHVRSLHSSAAPSSPLLMCIAVYTAAPKFADGIDPVSSQINISISRVDTGSFSGAVELRTAYISCDKACAEDYCAVLYSRAAPTHRTPSKYSQMTPNYHAVCVCACARRRRVGLDP